MARKPATPKIKMTAAEKRAGVPACLVGTPQSTDLWLQFIDALKAAAKLIPYSADAPLEDFSILVDCEIPGYRRSISFGQPCQDFVAGDPDADPAGAE